jgi:hypothetical protein
MKIMLPRRGFGKQMGSAMGQVRSADAQGFAYQRKLPSSLRAR